MLETLVKGAIYGAVAFIVLAVVSLRAPQSLGIDEINDSLGDIRSAVNNVDTSAIVDLDTGGITRAIENNSTDDITRAIESVERQLESIDRELCRALSTSVVNNC